MSAFDSNAVVSQVISPARSINGEILVPSDKSISHRAIILGSLCEGTVLVKNILDAEDCKATRKAMEALGVPIRETGVPGELEIEGVGLRGLKEPADTIDCGNSGTTMRLMMGLLAAQKFPSRLTGDQYLRKRPMDRIIGPLKRMDAKISGQDGDTLAPIDIKPAELKPISYDSPIASAQVKSAILLAGLYCDGKTTVTEPYKSRDHTERMLHRLGAQIEIDELTASVTGPATLRANEIVVSDDPDPPLIFRENEIVVPGDISSAAFFIAAAALLPGSDVRLPNVGFNSTRSGFLRVLRDIGQIPFTVTGRAIDLEDTGFNEPAGDLHFRGGNSLRAVTIGAEDIPSLIDEIPIIAVLAVHAEGTTIIEGAEELRVKETDRLKAITTNLKALGADIDETKDGLIIRGPQKLHGGTVDSFGDHRMAMAMAIAALTAENPVTINDTACVATSFPEFFEKLDKAVKRD